MTTKLKEIVEAAVQTQSSQIADKLQSTHIEWVTNLYSELKTAVSEQINNSFDKLLPGFHQKIEEVVSEKLSSTVQEHLSTFQPSSQPTSSAQTEQQLR